MAGVRLDVDVQHKTLADSMSGQPSACGPPAVAGVCPVAATQGPQAWRSNAWLTYGEEILTAHYIKQVSGGEAVVTEEVRSADSAQTTVLG